MGRPRLHHSLKEQTEAARAYRRTYYRRYVISTVSESIYAHHLIMCSRNCEEFRLKNKERYLQRKCR